MYIFLSPNHFAIHQKPTKYCKSAILKLKKKKTKNPEEWRQRFVI